MNIKFENSVLTIKTGIEAATFPKAGEMENKDSQGNTFYKVTKGSVTPTIGRYGIATNAVVDGELAIIVVYAEDVTLEDIKEELGAALVIAAKNIPEMQAAASAYATEVNSLFA